MKKYFFNFMLIFFAGNLFAHQPDVSTTLLSQQANGKWALQVKAALTAFEYEVATSFPNETFKSPEEFQELVIRHVTENVSIVFDENYEIKLQKPFVKLGHETNAVFEVEGVPENFSTIQFKNSTFKDINRNQSALVILKEGFSQEQFVLNNRNNHSAQLKVKGAQFVSLAPSSKAAMAQPNIFLGLAGLGLAGLLFMFLKFRQRKVTLTKSVTPVISIHKNKRL